MRFWSQALAGIGYPTPHLRIQTASLAFVFAPPRIRWLLGSWTRASLSFLLWVVLPWTAGSAVYQLEPSDLPKVLRWSSDATHSILVLQSTSDWNRDWRSSVPILTGDSEGVFAVDASASSQFYRLIAADIEPTPEGFANWTQSYGKLSTIAGKGQVVTDGYNGWQPRFEGAYATNVNLSRPHFAMADLRGNVYVVDKDSHSVLRINLDGTLHTVAGTHAAGDNGNGPTRATKTLLNQPNGLWVRPDGTFYILDSANHKIRKVDTNGIATTLVQPPKNLMIQRGLWVSEDESTIYFCSTNGVHRWTSSGITNLNMKFKDTGNLALDSHGVLYVTDRAEGILYSVDVQGAKQGRRLAIAGNGAKDQAFEGSAALDCPMYGLRGVWPLPTGGFLLATHEGAQLLYMDSAHTVHVLLSGTRGQTHSGDGEWFYTPGSKIGEARSVTLDAFGNILIVENDAGYVRRIALDSILRGESSTR